MRLLTTALVAISVLCGSQLFAQGQVKTKENLDLPYDAFGLNETEEEAPEGVVFYGQSF